MVSILGVRRKVCILVKRAFVLILRHDLLYFIRPCAISDDKTLCILLM